MFYLFLDSLVKAASRLDNLSILRALLNNVKLVDRKTRSGLLEAAANGESQIVKFLLQKGANPEELDKENKSALHHASEKGFFEIVQLLIENGANINAIDKSNKIPLHHACEIGDDKIVQYLIENNAYLDAKSFEGNAFKRFEFGTDIKCYFKLEKHTKKIE